MAASEALKAAQSTQSAQIRAGLKFRAAHPIAAGGRTSDSENEHTREIESHGSRVCVKMGPSSPLKKKRVFAVAPGRSTHRIISRTECPTPRLVVGALLSERRGKGPADDMHGKIARKDTHQSIIANYE